MTPQEREELRRLIAAALQPIREDVDALQKKDKRHDDAESKHEERLSSHSLTQKDLPVTIRRSVNDVKEVGSTELHAAVALITKTMADNQAETSAKLAFLNTNTAPLATVPQKIEIAKIDSEVAQKEGQTKSTIRTIATIISFAVILTIQHFLAHPP